MSDQRTGGRHPVNIGHLVMGLAFLGIVGIWALVQTEAVTGAEIRWLLPIPWVFAGVVGLAATAFTGSRRYAVRQTGWVGGDRAAEPPVEEPLDQPLGEPLEETAPHSTARPAPETDPETDLETEAETQTHPEEKQ